MDHDQRSHNALEGDTLYGCGDIPEATPTSREQVYVLMTKDHRVSRSRRAKWYISHLQSIGATPPFEDDMEDEMHIIDDAPETSPRPLIDYNVYFLSHHYSIVFVIDMTSTMMQVSNETFSIKLDEAIQALVTLLEQLKDPVTIEEEELRPLLCISVLAYSGSTDPQKRVTVIVQGADLNKDNTTDLTHIVRTNVYQLENKISHCGNNGCAANKGEGGRADNCLERMIKAGLLGIQLLPRGAMKGLVILTDGIGGFATPTSMYNTVNQLRTANISCWAVLCGGGSAPSLSLGSIPDTQSLAFLTQSCNGCVIDPSKLRASSVGVASHHGNPSHRCILYWTLQSCAWEERRSQLMTTSCEPEGDPFVPPTHYTQNRTSLALPLTTLIGCRIREGFFVEYTTIKDTQLEIMLTYPWQPNITINYNIKAPWPVTMTTSLLLVTVSFEAPYPFVRDFQLDTRTLAGLHASALKRFKQTLKSLTHSDTFLSHSTAFSSNPQFYLLPNNFESRMPLFNYPPNQSKPVPSTSLQGPAGKSLQVLCKYWTPLCLLEFNIWPKWMHTDKIVLVLSQDSALPPHLLSPSPSGRYSSLQCRVAAHKLFTCLSAWASLVLVENQLYIKFLPADQSSPHFFCAIRVALMHPCVLLHLGYIEGTPHRLQLETVSNLNVLIRELAISLPMKTVQGGPIKKKRSLLPQQPCATIIDKQLQKALISYDLLSEGDGSGTELPVQLEYLDHHQWQWAGLRPDPDLLMGLLQQRLREGFMIASASNGIITLVAQIYVKQPSSSLVLPSLIQYVICPFNQGGVFSSEVWVEPQYLSVSDTPPGLEYLRNEMTLDIAYKIHSRDITILTQITTFLELSSEYAPPPPTTPTSFAEVDTMPISWSGPRGKPLVTEVRCDLSSLFSKSHVTTLSFSAFTEGCSPGPLTLDNCSSLNRLLNTRFHELLQQRLTTHTQHVRENYRLIERLEDSRQSLGPFLRLFSSDTCTNLLWRCFIVADSNGLFMIMTPCFVCCIEDTPTSDDTTTSDDMLTSKDTPTFKKMANCEFVFPIVLMYTTLPHLLGEESIQGGVAQPLPPDAHYNSTFQGPHPSAADHSAIFNLELYNKIKRIHTLAYLQTLRDSLSQQRPLATPTDLEKGLGVCTKSELSIDLNPLLMGVCQHCRVSGEEHVTMDTLVSLLETLGDQRCHAHSVSYSPAHSICRQREEDVSDLLQETLGEKGFVGIEGCGYYWYKEHAHFREPSVCSTTTEEDDSIDPRVPGMTIDGDSDSDLSNLELIFTPPSISTSRRVSIHVDHAPLFIRLSVVGGREGEEHYRNVVTNNQVLPLCLERLCPGGSDDSDWSLRLVLETFTILERHDLAELEDESNSSNPMASIHSCFRSVINSLKAKAEWLIRDELVSRARELFEGEGVSVPPSLLPSVTSHIQGSVKKVSTCLMEHQPVRFVLGHTGSSSQFLQFLSLMEVSGLKIHNADNNYFYFTPGKDIQTTPPKIDPRGGAGRSSTPAPTISKTMFQKRHRRTVSLTSDLSHLSSSSSLQLLHYPRTSISSLGSPLEEITDSMYEASVSNSVTSDPTHPATPTNLSDVKFWLVLRVVPRQVEVYLHTRCSQRLEEGERERHSLLCSSVVHAVQSACHRTNQWYLLKDLLDTHQCSPLLLPESSQAAWVEGTSTGTKEIVMDGETFSSCEFECKLQWREHVTPHWRLKNMGGKIALRITHAALEAFSIINRDNLYVLQDVMDDGNEAIFYLRVSESMCIGEGYNNDDPLGEERCETRATGEEDTISTFSFQRSSFDIAETPTQLSRQMSTSRFSLNSGTCESVVLELHGITSPSESMTSRLQRLIQFKLDDKALEMMCSSYTRNQRLELSNADVQFLQEYPERPSEVLSVAIPEWVSDPQALLYYLLQQFSHVFMRPQYSSSDGLYSKLCVPPAVDKVLSDNNLPVSLQQDLLSLYIRPVTRGRGMALISACLVSPEGNILPPIFDVLQPTMLLTLPTYEDIVTIETVDEFPVKGDTHTIGFHIWERGNAGMSELRKKLISCVHYSLIDMLLEKHYLHLPVSILTEEQVENMLTPGLLRRVSTLSGPSPSTSECTHSFVDVTLTSSRESVPEHALRDMEEAVKDPVIFGQHETSHDWEEREGERRRQMCREVLRREGHTGQRGEMKGEYLTSLSGFLAMAKEAGVPEVFHHAWQVPANYLLDDTLAQTLSILSSSLASLSPTHGMVFSVFRSDPSLEGDYLYTPRDWVEKRSKRSGRGQRLDGKHFVIVGRDLTQWREAMDPHNSNLHCVEYWGNEQQYTPLSSWKQLEERGGALMTASAKRHETFIPRQRMVLCQLADGKLQLWMYNVIEDRVREVKARLGNLENWQLKRCGLLHSLVSQKMGLFHHTGARDVASLAQKASRYCSTLQGATALINNTTPLGSIKTRQSDHLVLDRFYLDQEPSTGLVHSRHPDPVRRHGNQFRDTCASQRDAMKQSELLIKVFNTWDSPDRRSKSDQATPISSDIVTKLKDTSRLLHHCSSSLWLLSNSYVSNLPDTSSVGSADQQSLSDASSWFNIIKEKFINEYISYLRSFQFQLINERPPSKPKGGTPDHSAVKFHRCLQRSWAGGIILIELSFQQLYFQPQASYQQHVYQPQLFLVKLFSLELSRSRKLTHPSQDVTELFSQECSRFKDLIHTHSYNYDFHVRSIHSIVMGRLKVEGELDLRNLLNKFCNNYVNPPHYIRNRIYSDRLQLKVSVPSHSLYTHIIGHCGDYGLQRVDVIQTSGDGCGSSIAWDNCLMIDLRPSVVGTVTVDELYQVMSRTNDVYNVLILALPDVNEGAGPVATELPLVIYILLVNKLEIFPRLAIDSPLVSSRTMRIVGMAGEAGSDHDRERESQFHDSVKFHRRKMGYGNLGSPSAASEIVFNPHLLDEFMQGLKAHFENVIRAAQNHVRRNELWKRLLYGGMSPEITSLNFAEFLELLQLVHKDSIVKFDPDLESLPRQTKRWYHGFIEFLQPQYSENFRLFTNENQGDQYAVIINQGWYDMFIMVECSNNERNFLAVYRKSSEGMSSIEERKITANVEAEQLHVNEFVNTVCSYLWASIVNHTPSLPSKLRH